MRQTRGKGTEKFELQITRQIRFLNEDVQKLNFVKMFNHCNMHHYEESLKVWGRSQEVQWKGYLPPSTNILMLCASCEIYCN